MELEVIMRDTYTRLCRSAYDLTLVEDGAFKLKPPRSITIPIGVGACHIRRSL